MIDIDTFVRAPRSRVWDAWVSPADIVHWNAESDDWRTRFATLDLREGGRILFQMEARDRSEGFDVAGTIIEVVHGRSLVYRLNDGRRVSVAFSDDPGGTRVRQQIDPSPTPPLETQRRRVVAVLDRFARYAEAAAVRQRTPVNQIRRPV